NVTELTRSLVATYYESFAAGKQPSDESLTKLSRDMAEPLRALGYAVYRIDGEATASQVVALNTRFGKLETVSGTSAFARA
ncbi:MAG: hypothetical protein Q9Q40_02645, partial [Acidobacteriota bacterium]|nr:hypothetical protein [Acidobacteriota bacterium]